VGDAIRILGEIFTVQAIANDTGLTLDSNHAAGAPGGTTAYRDPVLLAIDTGDAINKLTMTRSGHIGIGGVTDPDEQLELTGRVHLGQTTTPADTSDKLYNVAGALHWDGIDLTAASANPSFASISSGLNMSAGMEVGSGASLYASGTGIVRATDLAAAASVVADAEVDDNISISNTGSVHWGALNNYPAACGAGMVVQAVGGALTCVADDDAPDDDTEVPDDLTIASTKAGLFAPTTDVSPLTLRRGTDTAPAADLLVIRDAADATDLFRIDENGSLLAGTVPWGRVSGFTGDTTPDTIADDNIIALGVETSGTYDATSDTIADDGAITDHHPELRRPPGHLCRRPGGGRQRVRDRAGVPGRRQLRGHGHKRRAHDAGGVLRREQPGHHGRDAECDRGQPDREHGLCRPGQRGGRQPGLPRPGR
jgi:hypothetical protein